MCCKYKFTGIASSLFTAYNDSPVKRVSILRVSVSLSVTGRVTVFRSLETLYFQYPFDFVFRV